MVKRLLAGLGFSGLLAAGLVQPSAWADTGLTVLSSSSWTDSGGYLHVVGEVQNPSSATLEFSSVVLNFYDASGTLLTTDTTYTLLDELKPGEKSPFTDDVNPPSGYDHFSVSGASGSTATDPVNQNFTVTISNDYTDNAGEHVVGTVTNNNTSAAQFVQPVFTFYDSTGKVVDADFTFVSTDSNSTVQAGQSAPFQLDRLSDAPTYASKVVIAQSSTAPTGGGGTGGGGSGAPQPRSTTSACPPGQVPADGFTDVPSSDPSANDIACVVWWQVAHGTSSTTYAPGNPVPRDQMAAFIARLILRSGGTLPQNPPNAFSDTGGDPFQQQINQLAAAGIVKGNNGKYQPLQVVGRGAMAAFLNRAYSYRTNKPLSTSNNYFSDTSGSVFQQDINDVASVGVAGGFPDGTYRPDSQVQRDQMASFLARELDLLVANGYTTPPGS